MPVQRCSMTIVDMEPSIRKNSCEYPQNGHEARPERFLRGIQTMRSNNTSVCHSRTEAQSGLRIALTIAAVEAGAAMVSSGHLPLAWLRTPDMISGT